MPREGQEEVEAHLRLAPSGEDQGARVDHRHDGHHHWSACLPLPQEPEAGRLGPRVRV